MPAKTKTCAPPQFLDWGHRRVIWSRFGPVHRLRGCKVSLRRLPTRTRCSSSAAMARFIGISERLFVSGFLCWWFLPAAGTILPVLCVFDRSGIPSAPGATLKRGESRPGRLIWESSGISRRRRPSAIFVALPAVVWTRLRPGAPIECRAGFADTGATHWRSCPRYSICRRTQCGLRMWTAPALTATNGRN